VGVTSPGCEDLNERSLRAEFGPFQRGKEESQFNRQKEIAMSVTTISPQRLAELCKCGKIDLLDVRTPVEFRELHVEHARNVPLDRLDPTAVMQGRNGGQNQPLYLICRSGSRGRQACEKFLAAGFTNVINVEGGTLACVECGLSVVRGKKAISLERQVRIAAGSLVLLGVLLGWLVYPALLGLSAFVGAGLVFAGITDTCGMGLLLARMPWNQIKEAPANCGTTKEVGP
jgi:rhodanese-related sulfurtransferase